MSLPRLSVLIFSRNDVDHLRNCLQLLRGSASVISLEVLVFDNASEDQTLALLEQTRAEGGLELRWIAESDETSFSAGNNVLLADARAPWVLFLNPDTLPQPQSLRTCVEAAEYCKDLGLLSPRLRYPDGSHQPTGWFLPRPGQLIREHGLGRGREVPAGEGEFTEVGWLMGCFLLGCRDHLRQLGGFDEAFWFHGTDLELCARVAASGRRVVRLESEELIHVGHRTWDSERRRASQDAMVQWLARDVGPISAAGVAGLSQVVERLR